jgi:hypothetical protein
MEELIDNYYNSPKFQEHRKILEQQGKTKEECLEFIKSNLIDKTKLKNNLDVITQHNIQEYFNELSTNNTINQMLYTCLEKIFVKHFPKKTMREIFEFMMTKVSQCHKQTEILELIHLELSKFTKEYTQHYFNNISIDKQITDIIRANLSFIIKKEFGGNINIAIEQTITEMYKKNIVDFSVNMDKVRLICIQENIPFEELLTATFQNIETKMVEQANFIISNEIRTYQEKNRVAMKEYLNSINIQTKNNTSETNKCKKDITHILETLQRLTTKLEEANKKKNKDNIELIKRVSEQSAQRIINSDMSSIIKKTLNEQVENFVTLLLDSRLEKINKKIKDNDKKFNTFKTNEINSYEKRLKDLEKENSSLINKQRQQENEIKKINELEIDIKNMNDKLDTLCNHIKTKDNDKLLNSLIDKIDKIENKMKNNYQNTKKDNQEKKFDKLNNSIIKSSKELNKKIDGTSYEINSKFSKIDVTLKSMSEKSVNQDIHCEKLIYNKIEEQIPKLSSIISDNIQKGYFENMRDITQRITDLQSQVTMINQYTFNMPKTYLFQ